MSNLSSETMHRTDWFASNMFYACIQQRLRAEFLLYQTVPPKVINIYTTMQRWIQQSTICRTTISQHKLAASVHHQNNILSLRTKKETFFGRYAFFKETPIFCIIVQKKKTLCPTQKKTMEQFHTPQQNITVIFSRKKNQTTNLHSAL